MTFFHYASSWLKRSKKEEEKIFIYNHNLFFRITLIHKGESLSCAGRPKLWQKCVISVIQGGACCSCCFTVALTNRPIDYLVRHAAPSTVIARRNTEYEFRVPCESCATNICLFRRALEPKVEIFPCSVNNSFKDSALDLLFFQHLLSENLEAINIEKKGF